VSNLPHLNGGYKPKGRPTLVERAAMIKAEKRDLVKNPPQVKSWGGRRAGSGRKKRVGPPPKKITMVRMDRVLAEKLEVLPKGDRSEYIRQALELMKDIQPPEKFLASGKKKKEVPDVSSSL
jgi:hypothetical protein